MKMFVDNQARQWPVIINVDAIKRVRSLLAIDLLEVIEGQLIDRLMRDPILLCDIIYAVCKPTADSLGVSDEDFGRAMAGDAIEAATRALLDELVDFSPSPKDRANLRRILAAAWGAMDRARDTIHARLDDGELDRAIDQALEIAGTSSTDAPASSESTPDP